VAAPKEFKWLLVPSWEPAHTGSTIIPTPSYLPYTSSPWNPAKPIEIYFDRLEDCYVTTLISSLPFTTMAQMIDMTIMTL
jgi:hypothetical protein